MLYIALPNRTSYIQCMIYLMFAALLFVTLGGWPAGGVRLLQAWAQRLGPRLKTLTVSKHTSGR